VRRRQEYALGGLGRVAQDQEELPLEAEERQRQMGNVEMEYAEGDPDCICVDVVRDPTVITNGPQGGPMRRKHQKNQGRIPG
jgi:hypothetical protein